MLEAGDVIIDGGNTHYHDDIRRAKELGEKGIHHVDVGTSGGVYGLERGFCLMIGGEDDVVERLYPLFASIAPGVGMAPRTPGRTGDPGPAENGYLHCGPNGAGHFVKMVHNGIEYGIMAAYAEGLNILHSANVGKEVLEGDAETAPMEHPEYYQYDIDTVDVTEVWRRGQRDQLVAARPDRAGAVRVPDARRTSRAGCRIQARGAGRRSRRSTRACRRRC